MPRMWIALRAWGSKCQRTEAVKWMWYIEIGQRIGDKCEEVSIWRSNCTNGVVWSRGMWYEKLEKESECFCDEVFE